MYLTYVNSQFGFSIRIVYKELRFAPCGNLLWSIAYIYWGKMSIKKDLGQIDLIKNNTRRLTEGIFVEIY